MATVIAAIIAAVVAVSLAVRSSERQQPERAWDTCHRGLGDDSLLADRLDRGRPGARWNLAADRLYPFQDLRQLCQRLNTTRRTIEPWAGSQGVLPRKSPAACSVR